MWIDKCARLNTKVASVALNIQMLNIIQWGSSACVAKKITKNLLMKIPKRDSVIRINLLTTISTSLFCCYEKVFNWEKFN